MSWSSPIKIGARDKEGVGHLERETEIEGEIETERRERTERERKHTEIMSEREGELAASPSPPDQPETPQMRRQPASLSRFRLSLFCPVLVSGLVGTHASRFVLIPAHTVVPHNSYVVAEGKVRSGCRRMARPRNRLECLCFDCACQVFDEIPQ